MSQHWRLQAVEPGQGQVLGLVSYKEDSTMVLASINVHMVEGAFKNGCHQYLCLQGDRSLSSKEDGS